MLSVTNSCGNDDNSKQGKNRLETNARPSRPTPTNPRPRIKIRMKSSEWAQIFGENPWGCAGGGIVTEKH